MISIVAHIKRRYVVYLILINRIEMKFFWNFMWAILTFSLLIFLSQQYLKTLKVQI